MSKREEYQYTIDDNLALWNARLKRLLPTGAEAATPEAKQRAREWTAKATAAAAKLTQLKRTEGDKWDLIKLEMATMWDDLEASMTEAEKTRNDNEDAQRAGSPTESATT